MRGYLHQVQPVVSGCCKGLMDGNDSDLATVRADDPDLPCANVPIDVDTGIV